MADLRVSDTYKGRKLQTKKGRDFGQINTYIGGQLVGTTFGSTREQAARAVEQLKRDVDFYDQRRQQDPKEYTPERYPGIFKGAPPFTPSAPRAASAARGRSSGS